MSRTRALPPRAPARWWAWGVWLVWLVTLPLVVYHAKLAWDGNSNRVEDWIPRGHGETRAQDRFVDLFSSDEFLVARWEDCRLGDPRLDRLHALFLGPEEPLSGSGPGRSAEMPIEWSEQSRDLSRRLRHHFRRLLIGNQVYRELSRLGGGISDLAVRARMHGWLLGDDGRQTGVIALVSPAGMEDRREAVAVFEEAAQWATGLPLAELQIAGTTMESVAIDRASRRGLLQLSAWSFLVAGVVIVVTFGDLRAGLLLLLVALYNMQLALAMVSWTGGRTDAVLLLMANVMFVLSISGGCHLMRYFREALIEVGPLRAPAETARAALRPLALATLTSAIGFGSLVSSEIIPIRNFGFYSGIMIALSGTLVMLLVLSAYTVLPARGLHRKLLAEHGAEAGGGAGAGSNSGAGGRAGATLGLRLPTAGLERWANRWQVVIPLFFVVLVAGGLGLPRLTAALGVGEMFPASSKLLRDYRKIERELTPLIPVEVIVSVPAEDRSPDWLAEVGMVDQVVTAVRDTPAIEVAISSLNFMPPPPLRGRGIRAAAQRQIFQANFADYLESLSRTGFVRQSDGWRHWRISGRIRATANHDFAGVQRQVRETVARTLGTLERPLETRFQISGGALIFERMQKLLLRDMGYSFLLAVGLIGVVMSLVLRSPLAGCISLFPNVVPPVVIFGAMGWLGWPLEIGAVLTASAAIGVAIDDTLHLIYAFATRGAAGATLGGKIGAALAHCGPAMVQTTVICCCGLIVFAFSQFLPIVRFAWVITILLGVALLCDLILLPALLASPLGRRFARD